MSTAICLCLAQTLLTFHVEGDGPVRFGFPLPAKHVARGLHVEGGPDARLQWSLLQRDPDLDTGRVWVELALVGASGRVVLRAGGAGPVSDEGAAGGGRILERVLERGGGDEVQRETTRWRWRAADGTPLGEDVLDRTMYLAPAADGNGETFEPGEALSRWNEELLGRRLRVRIGDAQWRKAGVLPPEGGLGREYRQALLEVIDRLPRAPGERGLGDYVRGGEQVVITNLEFDTTLAFAQLGLATGSADCLRRCYESARHLIDRDLDRGSGLPFRHGPEHRRARPEPGHCWLRGLLLAGCLFADRMLIEHALAMGRALDGLARSYGAGRELRDDRARDVAWPLWELEGMLRFSDEPGVRSAADRLADNILRRWDAGEGVLRFGEGEPRDGEAYRDRCWLTSGMVLPALRLHARRTSDRRARQVIEATERRLLDLIQNGQPGLPLRYWVRGGATFGELRQSGVPECFVLLEGLSPRALARCLGRRQLRSALDGALDPDHPDLATTFTMIARCSWVLR